MNLRNIRGDLISLVAYPFSTCLSFKGTLSSNMEVLPMEVLLIVWFIVANILWTHIFYKKWSMLILELQQSFGMNVRCLLRGFSAERTCRSTCL